MKIAKLHLLKFYPLTLKICPASETLGQKSLLKVNDTLPCFPHFSKGELFDFLFVSLLYDAMPKYGLLFKEGISLHGSKFFSSKKLPIK